MPAYPQSGVSTAVAKAADDVATGFMTLGSRDDVKRARNDITFDYTKVIGEYS